MADLSISSPAVSAAPADYKLSNAALWSPLAVTALLDGTSASGDFLPTLEIVNPAGMVVARVPGPSVTAGSSAEVTWAPFLRTAGGSTATTFSRAVFSGLGQSSIGATTVRQIWSNVSTNDATVFAIDGADNTKANLLKAGTYLFSGYFGMDSASGHTMNGNCSPFLVPNGGGGQQILNWPTAGETNQTYPNIGGGHGAISSMGNFAAAGFMRIDWHVATTDQAFVELSSILNIVKID